MWNRVIKSPALPTVKRFLNGDIHGVGYNLKIMEVKKVSVVVGYDARVIAPHTCCDAYVVAWRPCVTGVGRIITVGAIGCGNNAAHVGRINTDAWLGAAGGRN